MRERQFQIEELTLMDLPKFNENERETTDIYKFKIFDLLTRGLRVKYGILLNHLP